MGWAWFGHEKEILGEKFQDKLGIVVGGGGGVGGGGCSKLVEVGKKHCISFDAIHCSLKF